MAKARAAKTGAGELTEQLTLLSPTPVAVVITSITRSGATVTVTTSTAHGFTDGDFVTLSGVTPAGYTGEFAIDVTGASSFTFTVAGSPDTPATVPGAVVFTSDSQGGQGSGWYQFAVVFGQVEALSGTEILQAQALGAVQTYTAKIYTRPGVIPTMRVLWTPYLQAQKTLEIHRVQPDRDEPRRFLALDLGEVI